MNAYSVCSATALELEGWAIPSAYGRPAEFAGRRSFEVEVMAARAADVPAFAVLSR
jgi:hypothetical protein